MNNNQKRYRKKCTEPQGIGNNNKRCIIHIISISGEKRKKEYVAESVNEEIMAEHFPNLTKYTNLQIQKAEKT